MERYYFTFGVGFRPRLGFQYTEEQWQVSKEKYDRMQNWRTVGEWHEGYTQAELFNLEEI